MGILKLDKYLPAEMAKTRGAEIEKILSDDAALHAIKELGPEFYARACERRGSAGVAEAARKELNRLHEAGTQVRDQGEIIIGVMNLTNLGLTVEEAKKRSAEIASITGSTIEAGATVAKPAELVTAVAKS